MRSPREKDIFGSQCAHDLASALLWLDRGVNFEREGRWREAIAAYEQATVLQDDSAEAHFNLANALREVGEWARSALHYRKALAIQPQLACAWYNLADLHDERGECEAARQCLQQALAADPCYADAHFNLALNFEEVRQHAEAAHHWARYLQLDRDSAWAREARRNLQNCRERLDRVEIF